MALALRGLLLQGLGFTVPKPYTLNLLQFGQEVDGFNRASMSWCFCLCFVWNGACMGFSRVVMLFILKLVGSLGLMLRIACFGRYGV